MNILNEKVKNTRIFYRIVGKRVNRSFSVMFICREIPAHPAGRIFKANELRGEESKVVVPKMTKAVERIS